MVGKQKCRNAIIWQLLHTRTTTANATAAMTAATSTQVNTRACPQVLEKWKEQYRSVI